MRRDHCLWTGHSRLPLALIVSLCVVRWQHPPRGLVSNGADKHSTKEALARLSSFRGGCVVYDVLVSLPRHERALQRQ